MPLADLIEAHLLARNALAEAWATLHEREDALVATFEEAVKQGASFPCEYDPSCGASGRQLVHLKPCCDFHVALHGAGVAQTRLELLGEE